ncbi:MAG: glycosyltransferase [Candidatus Riflebacteria bacterium]|nr:glycosyltransferase [Candidatus Riflebacteria bacterium]
MGFDKSENCIHIVYVTPFDRYSWNFVNLVGMRLFNRIFLRNPRFFRWPKPLKAPISITKAISEILQKNGYRVSLYHLTEKIDIKPQKGDILLGHLMPDEGSVMNKNFANALFSHKFILSPYNKSITQVGFIEKYMPAADAFFALSGDHWFNSDTPHPLAGSDKKLVQLNMGIDPSDYPIIKTQFNPPGQRRFFYVGRPSRCGDEKGIAMLEELATKSKFLHGGCIFPGQVPGWEVICPPGDLTPNLIKKMVADKYDFFINCSEADAQATTVLEAMSWGFPVVCTNESGYIHEQIRTLKVKDIEHNLKVIEELQFLPDPALQNSAKICQGLLHSTYSWKKIQEKFIFEFEKRI